jgi:hypothetical protein
MVRTQASTICPATPQRTALIRFVEPTPTMEPVMVCVVLTGMPPENNHYQSCRRSNLRTKAVHWAQLYDALPHRADDSPAPEQRP